MTFSPARARLFDRYLSEDRGGLRPPWSIAEGEFIELCTGCGKCIAACRHGLLSRRRGGYPEIRFDRGECTFCGDCASVCKTGALLRVPGAEPWQVTASITASCLAYRGVECRSCGERCEREAIRFRYASGGIAHPQLTPEKCSGCGACHSVCPVQAIVLHDHAVDHPEVSA